MILTHKPYRPRRTPDTGREKRNHEVTRGSYWSIGDNKKALSSIDQQGLRRNGTQAAPGQCAQPGMA
jgi:hypothetical protein